MIANIAYGVEKLGPELVVLPAVDEDVGGGVQHQQQMRHQCQRLTPRIMSDRSCHQTEYSNQLLSN